MGLLSILYERNMVQTQHTENRAKTDLSSLGLRLLALTPWQTPLTVKQHRSPVSWQSVTATLQCFGRRTHTTWLGFLISIVQSISLIALFLELFSVHVGHKTPILTMRLFNPKIRTVLLLDLDLSFH